MSKNTTDMTVGNPTKHLLVFALPMLIGNIFQQLYNLADSIVVGRFIGSEAFASIGETSSITFLFFALCNGIGSGGGIVVSQYFGAHDTSGVKKCIINTGAIMLVTPICFGTAGYFLSPALLRILGTSDNLLQDAVIYTRYMCIGLLFVSLYNFIASILRALGDSKSPLLFLIVSTLINIILDMYFIIGFRMGIKGAALATLISQMISVVLSAIYAYKKNPYFRFEKSDFSITAEMCYKVTRLGIPLSLQFSLIAISAMAVQRVVNEFGSIAFAAFTATNRIEQLIHQPYGTLSASLATYCGQNYGAKDNERVYAGYKSACKIMLILTAFLVLLMQIGGGFITRLMIDDNPEVIKLAAFGLRITSLFYVSLGMINVIRGILNGLGDAFFTLFNGIVEVIARFTVPVFMTSYLGFGTTGIWLACGIVWFISGFTSWLRYLFYFRLRIYKQNQ